MEKNDGGPAFPNIQSLMQMDRYEVVVTQATGMTLRDYFAAKAMVFYWPVTATKEHNADECYRIADAMLKAREAK